MFLALLHPRLLLLLTLLTLGGVWSSSALAAAKVKQAEPEKPVVQEPVTITDPVLTEQRRLLEEMRSAINAFDVERGDKRELGSWRKQLGQFRTQSQKELSEQELRLVEQKRRVEQLGPVTEEDDPAVAQARTTLTTTLREVEKRLAGWKSLAVGIDEAQERLTELEQQVVRVRLLGRGIDLLQVVNANLLEYQEWWPVTVGLVRSSSGLDVLAGEDFVGLLVALFFGFFGGWLLRHRLRAHYTSPPPDDLSLALLHAIPTCLARIAPAVGTALAAMAFLAITLPLTPLPLVTQAVIAFGLYLALSLVVQVLFKPCAPAQHYLPMDKELSHKLARRLKVVMFLFVIGFLLFASPLGSQLPAMQHLMLRAVYFVFIVFNLIWAFWLIGEVSAGGHTFRMRGLLSLLLLIALSAELLGYRNLSVYLLSGLLGSIFGISVALFVGKLLSNLFDGLDTGRLEWERKLRSHLGVNHGELMPGLIWLRMLGAVALWGLLGYWLLKLWGLSDRGIVLLRSLLSDGFSVGSFHIVPTQWLGGILVFALLISLASWMRGQVVPHWLSRTRLDRGVRDSMATMSGYFFILLAAVLGLSIAGLDFSSLALIAGALSVGIGFGLQNVVNNFVSGLILLFERPIRTGDWIVVGDTEGYVRRISIRSTQIQTFDRADVIVPNSELIASQVTNWMLRDPWGRVIVPIGVAYGSDPEEVREILLNIARNHPECLADGTLVSAPRVIFRSFGDNSLNFELRFFIRNVDMRISVLSEVNFAVEKALRAANITIPFPQRDVHLNLVLGDGQSLGLEELRSLLHPTQQQAEPPSEPPTTPPTTP